jgi:septal ring factor EnvC (AmiA/AmiB activator)
MKYSITQIRKLKVNLEDFIVQTEETIDSAESADYPNESRLDRLNDRLDDLRTAFDALENIENY